VNVTCCGASECQLTGALRKWRDKVKPARLTKADIGLDGNVAFAARTDFETLSARHKSQRLGWSEREDDGSADVAGSCLGERLGSVGEGTAGGDRNLKLPVPESLREFTQLVSVCADVEVGDRDSALLAGRVLGDGRQPPAVGHRPDRASCTAACRVDRSGYSVTPRYRADLFGPFLIVVVNDLARPQRAYPLDWDAAKPPRALPICYARSPA
jgi:hypothetical protein